YLKGLQQTYGKLGKTYNLYDIDQDETPELFVATKKSKTDIVSIWFYDKKSNSAKKIKTYKNVTEIYTKVSKKRVVLVQKKNKETTFSELKVTKKTLSAPVIVKTDLKKRKLVYKKNNKRITKKSYNKYKKSLKDVLILRGSYPWLPSNTYGIADLFERPDIKDDFYFSVNYDYLKGDHINDSYDSNSHWAVQEERIANNLKEQFENTDKYTTDNIKRVRDYYAVSSNWDKRESEGLSPLKKVIDGIRSCNTLSELTEVLTDPARNPDGELFILKAQEYDYDTSELCMKIDFDFKSDDFTINPFVKSSAEDLENMRSGFEPNATYILGRLGFDKNEIQKLIKNCYRVEETLARAIYEDGSSSDYDNVAPEDIAGLISKHTSFPLGKLLAGYGVTSGKAQVYVPRYLTALDDYYKAENMEAIKSFLIVHNAVSALDMLDIEAYAVYYGYVEPDKVASITEEQKKEWMMESNVDYKRDCTDPIVGFMATAVESAYMENFVDATARKRVAGITEKVKEGLKSVVKQATWMSEAGRNAAIEKLDNLVCFIMSPDEIIDTSYMNVDKSMSYYDNYKTIKNNKLIHALSFIGKKYNRNRWYYDIFPDLSTTAVNAMYNPSENSFMLFEGLMGGQDFYNNDMTDEEILGKMGIILGHEMSHGLDPKGSTYDKNGNLVSTPEHPEGWFTPEDHKAFQEKINMVAEYYSALHPLPWMDYNGSKLTGEVIGDMGGLAATLEVAKTIPGFDYKKYFTAYADLWCDQSGLDQVETTITSDPHPIRYLRINLMLPQFDEFYETYDIHEGDGMYISPKDRIRVW
ncbi:MAG: M13 family metallopeptidase, partial [Eubacterium sp.]|nr:M13 family metallopeptidase [Eubacterium sp.]